MSKRLWEKWQETAPPQVEGYQVWDRVEDLEVYKAVSEVEAKIGRLSLKMLDLEPFFEEIAHDLSEIKKRFDHD